MDTPAPVRTRTTWLETLGNASALALLGIVATIASLPVLTAGAAIGSASAAVHDFCENGSMPPVRTTARRFTQALLPGLPATMVALAAALLLTLDVRALVAGQVPGGSAVLLATAVVGIALLGAAGLTVVEAGRRGGRGWLASARAAVLRGSSRPGPVLAMGLAVAMAVLLAAVIPVTTPILVGFALFALHAIARRSPSR